MSYHVYSPGRSGDGNAALIIMLHGCHQTAEDFAAGTRMNQMADLHGLTVVYPAQSSQANAMNCWNWFAEKDQERGQGEPCLIAAIARRVALERGIDQRRIYVAGMSAGGAMSVILGSTYPDLFAAVGVHSGLPYRAARDASSALSAMRGPNDQSAEAGFPTPRAIPTIVFHGDRDATVDPSNGSAIAQHVAANAARSGAPIQETVQDLSHGGRICTTTTYRRSAGPPLAEHWLVHGAGHAWCGGSPLGSFTDAAGPDASAEMVRFFLGQVQGGANHSAI